MADEKKTAPTNTDAQRPRRSTQPAEQGEVTTRKTMDREIGQAAEKVMRGERQKEIDAASRTTDNPEDAKDVDPAEAAAFEHALQTRGTGSTPLPQRRLPTDNSLPNAGTMYVEPTEEEIEDLAEAGDVHTSPMALKQARERDEQNDDGVKRQAFIVQNGGIHTASGKAEVGEKVMLTKDEAKHFNKLGRLAPYIED